MSGSIILDKSRIFCSLPWTRISFWVYFHFGVIIPRSPNLPVRRRLQWLFFGYWKTWQGIFHLPIPWLSPSESNAWHFLFPGGNVIKLNTHKMVLLVCAVKLEDSGCDARNAEFWPPVTSDQGSAGGEWGLVTTACVTSPHYYQLYAETPNKPGLWGSRKMFKGHWIFLSFPRESS